VVATWAVFMRQVQDVYPGRENIARGIVTTSSAAPCSTALQGFGLDGNSSSPDLVSGMAEYIVLPERER
jgi:hypothetical protein